MVRTDDCAEPSYAARREAIRLGIAIAAMMPMIATTISSSISEKPSCRLFFMSYSSGNRDEVEIFSRTARHDFIKLQNKIHAIGEIEKTGRIGPIFALFRHTSLAR